jgi:coenzyme F420-0:L-glutamate ligase
METNSFWCPFCTEDELSVELCALRVGKVEAGADLLVVINCALEAEGLRLEEGDVLALASKIVSYSQKRLAKLSDIRPSVKAKKLAKKYSLKSELAELVLREADHIYGGVDRAVLALKDGMLVPNVGVDVKNAPEGFAVLWPAGLREWVSKLREQVEHKTGKRMGVLVVDSGLVPLRVGTSGLALACAGFKPIRDHRSKKDLFGKPIVMTRHNVADDLAGAAHLLMGESTEKTPIVLIRHAPVDLEDAAYVGADMMMPPDECLFMGIFQRRHCQSQV